VKVRPETKGYKEISIYLQMVDPTEKFASLKRIKGEAPLIL